MSTSRSIVGTLEECVNGRAKGMSNTPNLFIDAKGDIRCLTPAARRLLGYRADQEIDSLFFSHVHNSNLLHVMRDFAEIVVYDKQKAKWLLRLRNAAGQWRWFKATVRNELSERNGGVLVTLTEIAGGSST